MAREEIIKEAAAEHRDTVCCGFDDPIADAQEASFIEGAQWADKTMIDKACEWLMKNIITTEVKAIKSIIGEVNYYTKENRKVLVEDFRKAMEE